MQIFDIKKKGLILQLLKRRVAAAKAFRSLICSFFTVSGRFQSGQMDQTVNLLSSDFGGSNPPLPTYSMNSDQ